MAHPVIVTDSTADIPEELVNKYDIHVVPLRLMFGEETLRTASTFRPKCFIKGLCNRSSCLRHRRLLPPIISKLTKI